MKSLSGSRVLSRIYQSRYWRNCLSATAPITHPVCSPSSQQHRCTSTSQTCSKASTNENNAEDAPIKYTSSKALHWSVENSFGRHKKRPWYKVAPLSIALTIFLAWVFLREETDIDRELEKQLHERLPTMFPAPSEADITVLKDEVDDNPSKE